MTVSGTAFLESTGATHSVIRMRWREGLSEPFDGRVTFVSDDPDIETESLLWTGALVHLRDSNNGSERYFHGVIEEAAYVGTRADQHGYSLRLRPSIHGLQHRRWTKIFQDTSNPDIAKEVLQGAGLQEEVFWSLDLEYPTHSYKTQYRESEFQFLSRLLEEDGIYYWFEHSPAGHTTHTADNSSVTVPVDASGAVPYSKQGNAPYPHITDVVWSTRLTSDQHLTLDWNWGSPDKPQQADSEVEDNRGLLRYEYPGGITSSLEGELKSADRLAEQLTRRYGVRGRTNHWGFAPCREVGILDIRPEALIGTYLVTSVVHCFDRDTGGDGAAGATPYVALFEGIPNDMVFRPARKTPKPKVFGKETAEVTGPSGEEIHVDEYGRIKVHFYWDRLNPKDDTASFWVRVQQMNNAGTMLLPRIGWEMDIAFENGDPDRPIALQKLYNDANAPPYELPANKTQGSLQSSTTPGGGGTNEIRMQDSGGGMEFFMHANRDWKLFAGHNNTEDVAVNSTQQIGASLNASVIGDETISVGTDQKLTIGAVSNKDITGDRDVSVTGSDDVGITKNQAITVDGARDETIATMKMVLANNIDEQFKANVTRTVGAIHMLTSATLGITEAVGGAKIETVGGAKVSQIKGSYAENIGAAKTLTAGVVKESFGGAAQISATANLMINVGGAYTSKVAEAFTMGGQKIDYNAGTMGTIKAGGTKVKLSGGSIKWKGSKLSIGGNAMVELKGEIVYKGKGSGGGAGGGGSGGGGAAGSTDASGDAEQSSKAGKKGKSKKVKKPTKKEQRLAAEPGNSPEQIAARKKVATHHYQTHGKAYDRAQGKVVPLSDAKIAQEVNCIDFNKPVIAGPPPPAPSTLGQLQAAGNSRGAYFAQPGSSPSSLGIGPEGKAWTQPGQPVVTKTETQYNISPQTKYLQSTANPCADTWSVPGTNQAASGGGTQYYMGNGYYQNHPQITPI